MPRKAVVFAFLLILAPSGAFAADQSHHKKRTHHGEPVVKLHGHASYYADHFQGHKTATGETFSQEKLTAASKTLPLGSKAVVRNAKTGEQVEVTVNDRGPYVGGRIIDLSKKAADQIGIKDNGVAKVDVEVHAADQPTADLKDAVTQMAVTKAAQSKDEAVPQDQAAKDQAAKNRATQLAQAQSQAPSQGR